MIRQERKKKKKPELDQWGVESVDNKEKYQKRLNKHYTQEKC